MFNTSYLLQTPCSGRVNGDDVDSDRVELNARAWVDTDDAFAVRIVWQLAKPISTSACAQSVELASRGRSHFASDAHFAGGIARRAENMIKLARAVVAMGNG